MAGAIGFVPICRASTGYEPSASRFHGRNGHNYRHFYPLAGGTHNGRKKRHDVRSSVSPLSPLGLLLSEHDSYK